MEQFSDQARDSLVKNHEARIVAIEQYINKNRFLKMPSFTTFLNTVSAFLKEDEGCEIGHHVTAILLLVASTGLTVFFTLVVANVILGHPVFCFAPNLNASTSSVTTNTLTNSEEKK